MDATVDFSGLSDDIAEWVTTDRAFVKLWDNVIESDIEKMGKDSLPEAAALALIEALAEAMRRKIGNHREDFISGYISQRAVDSITDDLDSSYYVDDINVSNGTINFDVIIETGNTLFRRESMLSEKYPNGVDSIIELLNSGYSAKNSIRGMWHGEPHISIRKRKGAHYFDKLISIYLSSYAGQYNVVSIYER